MDHSGFQSHLDQFNLKQKFSFLLKIISYGQIMASRNKLLNFKISCTS